MRYILLSLSLVCSSLSVSAVESVDHVETMTCPPTSALIKDYETQYWGTKEHDWRTHTMSFADDVTRFLGAQWNGNGTDTGTIYCLYKGSELTFPVKLEYSQFVHNPNGGKWTKDLGGFKNCVATDQADCAFVPIKKQQSKSLYEELDSLQGNHPGG